MRRQHCFSSLLRRYSCCAASNSFIKQLPYRIWPSYPADSLVTERSCNMVFLLRSCLSKWHFLFFGYILPAWVSIPRFVQRRYGKEVKAFNRFDNRKACLPDPSGSGYSPADVLPVPAHTAGILHNPDYCLRLLLPGIHRFLPPVASLVLHVSFDKHLLTGIIVHLLTWERCICWDQEVLQQPRGCPELVFADRSRLRTAWDQ